MRKWQITGLIATFLIILAVPIYLLRTKTAEDLVDHSLSHDRFEFVGSEKCKDCHRHQYDQWLPSDHRMAMAVANTETVLGNFNDAVFEHQGTRSRFFRKDGKFYVTTRGPEGKMEDFEVTHTFGYHPLQQYLVPFPGGRLQCLPIAWDDEKKRWYQLYPDNPDDPGDWLYWTNAGQNGNGMCAECHSTNLRKNYDPDNDSYQTVWSEISIGCEACHGPGSQHVNWAEMPDMARPQVENYRLAAKTSGLSSRQQIELCAPCHSRRMSLGNNRHMNTDLMDYAIPQLLSEGYYFADGQILDEVYVYGSFSQSKMYDRDVRCSDCHDVHSTKRLKEGNALCLQCHKAAVYDTKAHHFHKKHGEQGQPIKSEDGSVLFEVGTGAQCEQCHMPGRIYMGIDYRPDHSFRTPKPDLSDSTGVPNACNRCHADKSNRWSQDWIEKWYGLRQRPHYGTILYAGRQGDPEIREDLVKLTQDRLYPTIVRATALSLLARYPGEERDSAFQRALTDEESLIRYTAVRHLPAYNPRKSVRLIAPLLYDPVRAVRIEAANYLTAISDTHMDENLRKKYKAGLEEYLQAMTYTADFAASRHNLGILHTNLGQFDKAVENYRKSIQIDSQFYPAKVNLAMLYNQKGQNEAAEKLLREAAADHPEFHEISYSLGLLLAEEKKYVEAVKYLQKAAEGLPQHARVHYNLGQLLAFMQNDRLAEQALKKALQLEPENMDYLSAMAHFYVTRNNYKEAELIARQMIATHPSNKAGHELLKFLNMK